MKKTIMNLILMLFALCAFAQAPDWLWAESAGGSGLDSGRVIAIDDNGNSYVTGGFWDTATFGSYSLNSSGLWDIFVAKMDANGNWLWATKAGGSNYDYGFAIATDDNGNSYVTGRFANTATFGSYTLTSSGSDDIFVAKMDATGNWLWATKASGSESDGGYGIAIDDNGNSYVTGMFEGVVTFGSYSLASSGSDDIFVAKMDATGNWLWATQAGGSNYDYGYKITIDDSGNSCVTGMFESTVTFGSYSLTSSGSDDIFVAKMDATGNWLWATQAGGGLDDNCGGIAMDDNGNSYVSGSFNDTATFGSYSLTSSGEGDIFVAKIDAIGNWLWVTQAGGSESDGGKAITIDDNGNSYVTGCFNETAIFGSYSLVNSGGVINIFVAKMDSNGIWLWATQAGGSSYGCGFGIAIDDNGNCYVTGYFAGITTFGSYSLTSSGSNDIFAAKLGNNTSVENEIISTEIRLSNYPNPFNPTTTISFSIQNDSKVELMIYNIKGQKIRSLLSDQITVGEHSIVWNGEDASEKKVGSGIYLYKLNMNGKMEAVKKCLLLK